MTAVICPPRHESVVDRLIAEGQATPARRRLADELRGIEPATLDITTSEIIDDLRGPY